MFVTLCVLEDLKDAEPSCTYARCGSFEAESVAIGYCTSLAPMLGNEGSAGDARSLAVPSTEVLQAAVTSRMKLNSQLHADLGHC